MSLPWVMVCVPASLARCAEQSCSTCVRLGVMLIGGAFDSAWTDAWGSDHIHQPACVCRAGLTGVLLALMAVRHQAAAPVAHLRAVNPYVQASLQDWGKQGLQAAVPRALGPAVALHAAQTVAGERPWLWNNS